MYGKADTHIHTTISDGLMTPEETVEYIATHTDLNVISITDHGSAEGSMIAQDHALRKGLDIEVIIGQEIYTGDGDIVGLFLKSNLPYFDTAIEAIEAIHAQGGLAVSVHPFSRWSTLNNMNGLGAKIFDLPLDAVEVRNGFPANILSNPLSLLLNRYKGQHLSEFGGSDSHSPFTVGQAYTQFPGRTAADFRKAVENGTVKVKGSLWTPINQLRFVSALLRRHISHQPEPIYSD